MDKQVKNKSSAGAIVGDLMRNTVVPAAGLLLLMSALRNSVTSHLQQFWGFNGSIAYEMWYWIYYTLFGGNELLVYVVGTLMLTYIWFWTLCGLFLAIDLTQRPAFALKFKVQPGTNTPLKFDDKLKKCIKVVLRNQMLVSPPFQLACYYMAVMRGCQSSPETLPDFSRVVFDLLCFVLIEEVGFYYTHLLVHQPYFYKRVHKQHHEWTAPIGVVCIYAHPFEYLLSNIGPLAAGPLLMGSHLSVFWLWMVMAVSTTVVDHSGYHLPFTKSPEFHDYHHLTFNNCYGVLGLLDWLHGTDLNFRNSRAYPRHRVLLSTAPLNGKSAEEVRAQGVTGAAKAD